MEIPGVVLAFGRNGWMNEALTMDWVTMDWVTRVWGTLKIQRHLLMWDAYRCHLMCSVSSHVKKSTNFDKVSSLVDSPAIFSLPMFLGTNHSMRHTRHSTMSGWHKEKSPILYFCWQHAHSR